MTLLQYIFAAIIIVILFGALLITGYFIGYKQGAENAISEYEYRHTRRRYTGDE